MRTLLDRNTFSFRNNGQVAARRVTGLIIKRLVKCSIGIACVLFYDDALNQALIANNSALSLTKNNNDRKYIYKKTYKNTLYPNL